MTTSAHKPHGSSAAPDAGPSRRDEIAEATAPLIARYGFHGVSIEGLGGAAGMTGPGLYRHFSGKDALLAHMLLRISERLQSEGSRRVLAARDASEALDALLSWHIEFALSRPALITVHDRELGNVPAQQRRRIRRLQRLYVEEWVTVLSELVSDSGEAQLRAATHATFGLLNSTPHSAGELPPSVMAELLHGMARGALLAVATRAAG